MLRSMPSNSRVLPEGKKEGGCYLEQATLLKCGRLGRRILAGNHGSQEVGIMMSKNTEATENAWVCSEHRNK